MDGLKENSTQLTSKIVILPANFHWQSVDRTFPSKKIPKREKKKKKAIRNVDGKFGRI